MRETPETTDERSTVKAKYPSFFMPVLFGMVMTAALCALVLAVASFAGEGRWERAWAWGFYGLASLAVTVAIRTLLPKGKGNWRDRQYRWPDWSLFTYFFINGLGLNWACAFLLFSRRYAFFSTPVIGATGLIIAFYAAIALLVAWFEALSNNVDSTGMNWRAALLVFAFVPNVLPLIVLRLHLLL